MFYIIGGGGEELLYTFDRVAMTAARMGSLGNGSGGDVLLLHGEPEFSFTNPDLLYGQSTAQTDRIAQYAVSTGIETLIRDIQADLPGVASHNTGMSISSDGQRFALGVGGASQDNDTYAYVYDRTLGARWLNVATGQIGGAWGPTGAYTGDSGFTSHNVRISRNGRWVRISPIGAPADARQYVWDITGTTLVKYTDWYGHLVMGYDHAIVQWSDNDSLQCQNYNFLTSTGTFMPTAPRSPALFDSEGHPSWNTVTAGELEPFIIEMWKPASTVDGAWDEEILAVSLDGTTVWRFCHHRTKIVGGFFEQPRPNVSRDGRYAMFSSNWNDTVGAARSDVFVVELYQPTAGLDGKISIGGKVSVQ